MATKEELEQMAKDLYKRLGGVRTKDGRIVRALLANWKAAELTAAQHGVQPTAFGVGTQAHFPLLGGTQAEESSATNGGG